MEINLTSCKFYNKQLESNSESLRKKNEMAFRNHEDILETLGSRSHCKQREKRNKHIFKSGASYEGEWIG